MIVSSKVVFSSPPVLYKLGVRLVERMVLVSGGFKFQIAVHSPACEYEPRALGQSNKDEAPLSPQKTSDPACRQEKDKEKRRYRQAVEEERERGIERAGTAGGRSTSWPASYMYDAVIGVKFHTYYFPAPQLAMISVCPRHFVRTATGDAECSCEGHTLAGSDLGMQVRAVRPLSGGISNGNTLEEPWSQCNGPPQRGARLRGVRGLFPSARRCESSEPSVYYECGVVVKSL